VPPVSTDTPAAATSAAPSRSARMRAPSTVRSWRARNSSVAAILKATALPAMACMSGPPCWPGKTAESIFFLSSPVVRITPERGPARVLCTVEVTTWACGTGLACRPAATRPAKWAMSTHSFAPTSSATERNASKSSSREYADQPATMTCGRSARACSRTLSMSMV
jgi:hypothetical protein